jgi:ribosome-associated protein
LYLGQRCCERVSWRIETYPQPGRNEVTMTEFYDDEQYEEGISKTQVKRELQEMRDLGRRLVELKPAQLQKLELTEELRVALEEAHRHTARGALKRHLSFVGKLMKDQDVDAIRAYIDRLDSSTQAHAQHFHQMERWRDRLLTGSAEEQEAFMSAYPQTERQTLRQLVRQASKEAAENKPPHASCSS